MPEETLYDVIGVRADATPKEIEEACLRFGAKFRPDRNPGDANAARMFRLFEEALLTLTDPGKRAVYDLQAGIRTSEPKQAIATATFRQPLEAVASRAEQEARAVLADPNASEFERFAARQVLKLPEPAQQPIPAVVSSPRSGAPATAAARSEHVNEEVFTAGDQTNIRTMWGWYFLVLLLVLVVLPIACDDGKRDYRCYIDQRTNESVCVFYDDSGNVRRVIRNGR